MLTLSGFFILWGLYFGILLVIEKIFLKKFIDKTKVFKYIYTSLIVVISFLIFNASSLSEIGISLKNMFLLNDIPLTGQVTNYYLRSYFILFIIAIIGATPLFKNILGHLNKTKLNKFISVLEPIFYLALLTLSTAYLIDASFNPFLYFRF